MPFFFVQIAPYSYGADNSDKTTRPLFVESQIKSLELIPNSKMATTTDLGSELCIHPAQKREVGSRLALLAMSNTYLVNGIESEFPEIDTVEYIEGKAVIKFKSNQGVAVANGTCGELIKGFEIAGADKVFHPAKAYAQYGDARALVVESPDVAKPIAVRYAFRNYTEGNLVNHLGIAAPSFRTDNWDDVY